MQWFTLRIQWKPNTRLPLPPLSQPLFDLIPKFKFILNQTNYILWTQPFPVIRQQFPDCRDLPGPINQ